MNEGITPANIGGMGPTSFPGTGASINVKGSGDVSSPSGDANKRFKKKKKEREEELKKKKNESILHTSFTNFVNEEYVSEGTFQGNQIAIYNGEDGETYIEKKGKGYYGYNNEFDFTAKNKRELEQMLSGWGYYKIAGSLDEAKDDRSHIILRVAPRNVNNMAFKLQDMHVNHRVEDHKKGIIKVYTDPTSGWHGNEKAQYKLTHDVWVDKFVVKESVDEAKIGDARGDLGYVALLKEMSDLNNRDIQSAYNDALDVLEDKGMSEKQAIGFLNSPHGKYMAEYVIPGMDYGHEAFLYKLEEYYNERMLKQYAKDYIGLAK
tara:strand:- start:56 stop:1015 length:960 start_codon:yes stop_codon:yes gene_type:complete